MKSQKDIFRTSEGDAWFERNKRMLAARSMLADTVCQAIEHLAPQATSDVLEIGCGGGERLRYLRDRFGCNSYGIDPSPAAVQAAQKLGINAIVGTADSLPFDDSSFDFVIFGFCLYLCDDCDLFRIAQEANRVLRCPGWLLILDFDSDSPRYKPYHHEVGVLTRKMSYKSMFLWHPMFNLARYQKFDHNSLGWTDSEDEWVSLTVIRKKHSGGKDAFA